MTTSSQPTQRIFISHSHKDNEFGVRLVDDLRRVLGEESAVWYDERGGLHGGDPWWHKIMEELRARNIFIVVLSPDAVESQWVNAEIDLAWRQRLSKSGKHIIPLLYRQCNVRDDLDTLQIINFLPPKSYDEAFDELLIALGLHTHLRTRRPIKVADDPETMLVQQMAPQIETSFAARDWLDVIRKTNFLLKRAPVAITSDIYRMQAVALREEGQAQEAQEAFDTALALVSKREQRLTILRDYADLLASQERWGEVLRFANEALRLVPNDSGWLATQLQAQGKLRKATPIAEKSKEQVRGEIQRKVSSVPEKTKEQWLEEGNAHYAAKRYEEAIAAYNHAIEIDSRYAIAYNARGWVYYGLKNYEKALADYNRAIELDPKDALAYNNRGIAYSDLKEYQRALTDYNRAIELDPKFAWPYNNRGADYSDAKEYQKALADYDSAIGLDSKYFDAYYNRGNVYYEFKEYQKAIADFDRVIELNPKYAYAYGVRGRTYYKLKDYQRAIQDFDRALQLDPSITWFKPEQEDAIRQLRGQR